MNKNNSIFLNSHVFLLLVNYLYSFLFFIFKTLIREAGLHFLKGILFFIPLIYRSPQSEIDKNP